MTNTPIYETIINIAPSGNENRLSFELKLSPDDTIQTNGRVKRIRDCTLNELAAFADSLEADVGALLERTIGDLVDDPTVEVLRPDDDDLAWLDHLVIFDPLPDIEEPEVDAAVEQEITVADDADVIHLGGPPDPLLISEIDVEPDPDPAVAAEIAVVDVTTEIEEIEDENEDEDVTVKSEAQTDVLASSDKGKDAKADEEFDGLPELDGSAEMIPVEEIDPSAVSVAESEPIHEDREAEEPFDVEKFKLDRPSRTLGIVSDRWLDNTVDVMIDEDPLRRMQAHASSSLRREVAGVMLGPLPEKQPNTNRYIVHVQDMIIAKHTKMRGASVTYTPESWRYLNDVIMERYPNEEMVMLGWYHTHPGFGIFLSGMDLFIHKNFFTQKWHVAYVLDPIARKSGFFSWDSDIQQVKPFPFIWPEWAAGSW